MYYHSTKQHSVKRIGENVEIRLEGIASATTFTVPNTENRTDEEYIKMGLEINEAIMLDIRDSMIEKRNAK